VARRWKHPCGETWKSVGALGEVDDQVGPKGAKATAVVAEFRRMKDNVTEKEMKPLALAIFDLVEMLNAEKKGDLNYKLR